MTVGIGFGLDVDGTGDDMRVALVDDSALFRTGLAALLTDAGIEVGIQAREPSELLAALADTAVDVVIADIRMPPTFTDEGIRLAEQLRRDRPALAVLVLSTYAEPEHAIRLVSAGERGVGYLLKDRVDDVTTLVDALERLGRGESVVDTDVVDAVLRQRRASARIGGLTEREQAILRLMAEGRSNAGISGELFLSPKTVETHCAAVFRKLGLHAESTTNRRVLAVLNYLRADAGPSPQP